MVIVTSKQQYSEHELDMIKNKLFKDYDKEEKPMVYTRRYFLEITSLDLFTDEEMLSEMQRVFPKTNIKLHRSSIIEVRKR